MQMFRTFYCATRYSAKKDHGKMVAVRTRNVGSTSRSSLPDVLY